ncbi:MAG: hypothetical protein JWL69_3775 [Phycisphaerales bacterium]|nr:hypothetical protein [Phycisphaerales bacterium]MDB5356314.1 hypothetical protein [Phycisphaerales bacterium]
MANPLNYARPIPSPKTLALPAMICGLMSGPVGLTIAFVAFEKSQAGFTTGAWGVFALFVSLGGAFIFAMLVMLGLPKSSRPKDRTFSIIGAVAPIVWALVGFYAFVVLSSRGD